ncbi:MAG: extensin family protein [Paracoccaceae bacterium]
MWRVLAMMCVLAVPAVAEAPDTSLFPRARPAATVEAAATEPAVAAADAQEIATDAPDDAVDAAAQAALDAVTEAEAAAEVATDAAQAAAVELALASSPFPRARPELGSASDSPDAPVAVPTDRRPLLGGLFAPRPRPDRQQVAAPAPRGNGICGNPALTGVAVDPIHSRTNGCGVDEPVQITEVDGIRLSMAATMDCATANALAQWVDQGLRPAYDQEVVGLQVAGHYICRTRNHIRGARISEHGRGKAIDISGIILADGTVQTVANNWNRAMRAAYQAACGIFGTTLGPGSDGYHEDHMHFDTANHRNGPYCR